MWFWAHWKKLTVRLCLCISVGVSLPSLFQFLPPRSWLILLECSSYHHLEEFITLSPSLLPRPKRLRNKRAIVWGAAPWIQVCWHRGTHGLPILPIIRKGEKLIMLPPPRSWRKRAFRDRGWGPLPLNPAILKPRVFFFYKARATDQ